VFPGECPWPSPSDIGDFATLGWVAPWVAPRRESAAPGLLLGLLLDVRVPHQQEECTRIFPRHPLNAVALEHLAQIEVLGQMQELLQIVQVVQVVLARQRGSQ
jgi:hypothetical protein